MAVILSKLNKAYFWDVDFTQMDETKSKKLIIERVFNYGNLDEITIIKEFYGLETMKTELCNLNYIDPKTLNFLSLLFRIPKTKFKCYSRKRSTNLPWSY
jgi:hypothetical protein